MNWLSIIMMIVQFILGRIQPKMEGKPEIRPSRYTDADIRAIAKKIHQVEPQLNFDCVLGVLPDLLTDLTAVVKEKGIQDYLALINAAIPHIVKLVRCQLGLTAQADDPHLSQEISNKIISCGIKAVGNYFSSGDIGSAISGFISCLLSSTPTPPGGGGGTGGGGGNGGGGGINPTEPILRDVTRCP